jgi:signal transduction histidine kinase
MEPIEGANRTPKKRLDRRGLTGDASEDLLAAQEKERHRIAIELHDSTSQHLVAISLGLAQMRKMVGKGHEANNVIDAMSASLREAVTEIRVLSYLLNPPDLNRDGLETTTRRFVAGFGLRTQIRARFEARGKVDAAAPMVQHAAFRVVQEALTNVHRHAAAEFVEVVLTNEAGSLIARIRDNGRGIEDLRNPNQEWAPLGVGISGMRARVEQLGGGLCIRDEGGAVVTATMPLDPPKELARSAQRPRVGSRRID